MSPTAGVSVSIPNNPSNLWNILSENRRQIENTHQLGHPSNLWNILSEQTHIPGSDTPNFKPVSKQRPSVFSPPSESEGYSSDSAHSTASYESFSTAATEHGDDGIPTVETLLIERATIELEASSPAEDNEVANKIVSILQSYSPRTTKSIDRSIMTRLVKSQVVRKQPIHLVLPAFPFKSPNKVDKVLGVLPDMGEELALATLDGLCAQIDEVYPGTSLSIVSDGLVYNGEWLRVFHNYQEKTELMQSSDLLGVTETEVWNYGSSLRALAAEKFPHISLARLSKLISDDCTEPKTLEEYLANASWYRSEMVAKYLPKDFDVGHELRHQINSLMTYRGYIKFLATDLAHEPTRQGKTKTQVKKMNEKVAKRMIERGAVSESPSPQNRKAAEIQRMRLTEKTGIRTSPPIRLPNLNPHLNPRIRIPLQTPHSPPPRGNLLHNTLALLSCLRT